MVKVEFIFYIPNNVNTRLLHLAKVSLFFN